MINSSQSLKTHQEGVHPITPFLRLRFAEPTVWFWERRITVMKKGGDGNVEIQGV
jgi:hypothetical protein